MVGLVCLELFKIVQGHKEVEKYKNGFLNLALPFFAFSEPVPPKKAKYNGKDWTLWDRFVVTGEPTLGELIDNFNAEHGLEITMLSAGVAMLFAFFMAKDKQRERRGMKIPALVEAVTGKTLPSWQRAIVLEICCNDSEGNDVEVPFIQYMLGNNWIAATATANNQASQDLMIWWLMNEMLLCYYYIFSSCIVKI